MQSMAMRSPCSTMCPVTRPSWSKWWARPNVDPTARSGSGAMTPSKRRSRVQAVAVGVAELVHLAGLDARGSATPVGRTVSRQVGVGGQLRSAV